MTNYKMIVVTVGRDIGPDVVDYAREVGGQGATILHGHGAGSAEISKVFNLQIEPEKEVVLMVVDADITDKICQHLTAKLVLDEVGKGYLFTIDVNQTSGIYQA